MINYAVTSIAELDWLSLERYAHALVITVMRAKQKSIIGICV